MVTMVTVQTWCGKEEAVDIGYKVFFGPFIFFIALFHVLGHVDHFKTIKENLLTEWAKF